MGYRLTQHTLFDAAATSIPGPGTMAKNMPSQPAVPPPPPSLAVHPGTAVSLHLADPFDSKIKASQHLRIMYPAPSPSCTADKNQQTEESDSAKLL